MFSGVADLKKTFDAARAPRKTGQGTLLFVDEIHRFNRSQQDSFLPVVEDGTVILVGATTENPSFELNGALLSRAQVLVLRRLDDAALETLLERAETHYGEKLPLTDDARASLQAMADGDGRYLLNLAEEVARAEDREAARSRGAGRRRAEAARRSTTKAARSITISSPRCTNRSAAPIPMRRCIGWRACWPAASSRFTSRGAWCAPAVEDIGLADPQAVVQAIAAKDVYDFLGSPGRRTRAGAMRALSRERAEIERGLCGAWARPSEPRTSTAR